MKQRTTARAGSLSGTGLHTGKPCVLKVVPAPAGNGVVFFKKGVRLGSLSEDSLTGADTVRCSSIGQPPHDILTVEHFLAALSCLGITNLEAHVEGEELPGLDGSALGFVRFLKTLGFQTQEAPKAVWRVREPIFCHESGKAIQALPAEILSVAYILDYDHPALYRQVVDFVVTPSVFEKQIAPARTFCTDREAEVLRRRGFGAGADTSNTLVMTARGPLRNRLRFQDECARHKVLDLLGDLGLLGFDLRARIVGLRSGHPLNRQLVREIRRQKDDE